MSDKLKESALVTVSEADITGHDYVRVLDGDSSRKITCTDFADVMEPLLIDLGFLTVTADSSVIEFSRIANTSTSYNITSTNNVILCNTSAGAIDINLPSPASVWDAISGVSQQFTIKRVTNDNNTVTIAVLGAETIDGFNSYDLAGPNLVSVTVVSDGVNWHIIS